MTQATPVLQGLPPLLDVNTRLVVLGSFPGVASLRAQQYYGHPQNQFWKIMGTLLSSHVAEVMAMPYANRAQWLLSQGVGLWDVYAACEREGSLDANIQNAAKASNTPSSPALCACLCIVCRQPVPRMRVGRLHAS
jgi:hypoxanthine-DNA glycosylase